MPEVTEGPQPSQTEQGSTPAQKPETAQNQDTGWSEHAGLLAGAGKEEAGLEKPGSEKNPEVAEQQRWLAENMRQFYVNLGQFSEDDPNIPASQATKEKLSGADELLEFSGDMAKTMALPFVGASLFLEGFNYLSTRYGGTEIPPGFLSLSLGTVPALGVGVPAAFGIAGKGIEQAIKGYNKLQGLIDSIGGNKT